MLLLGDIVRLNAKRFAGKDALIMGDQRITFDQLNKLVNRLAWGLISLGLKKGDRIALCSRNCLDFIVIIFAVWKCGGIVVPINFRFKKDEMDRILENCRPKIIFHSDDLGSLVKEITSESDEKITSVAISRNSIENGTSLKQIMTDQPDHEVDVDLETTDLAMIMYTSGTTGHPKGVVFSHIRILSDTTNHAMSVDMKHDDIMLVNMPLFHNGGLSASLIITLLVGGTCVVHGGSFDPKEIFSTIEDYKISVMNLVPTMLGKMVEHPTISDYQFKSLKKIYYGSSPISEKILDKALHLFHADFYQIYAQTETGMLLVLKPADHFTNRAKFTGREMIRSEVRIVDALGADVPVGEVGEIISRQKPMGMDEYYGLEDATRETIINGWIHTGDLARVEPDGYYTIVDRLKDMIISGAENIYCKEIENVLYEHVGVEEAVVFGIPDDLWGETVCAVIVRKPGAVLSEDEIIDFCASRLSGYKKPKRVEFKDILPKNASGKLMKKVLREPYWANRDRGL